MNSPVATDVVKAMQLRMRKDRTRRGFWVDVTLTDDNDDEIQLECHVDVDAEQDPCGTGDSPTAYEVEIIECLLDGDDYDLSREGELAVNAKAIEVYKEIWE